MRIAFKTLIFCAAALSAWAQNYSIGTPTDAETLYVELVNRTRANPTTEGIRLAAMTGSIGDTMNFFSVNRTMLQTEMAALAPMPPLAINQKLTEAARGHSNWMVATSTQSHTGTNGTSSWTRIANTGYSAWQTAENIFLYSQDPEYGHAGFEVDWGSGTGGMQGPPRGHRVNIHGPYSEIGVGITNTATPGIGPEAVTQELASANTSPQFLVGVAYYDLNENNFYDLGEGLGNINVTSTGTTNTATTVQSGAFAVPLPKTAGTKTITFTGTNLSESGNLTTNTTDNVKADLRLEYIAPYATLPTTMGKGVTNTISCPNMPGIDSYLWKTFTLATAEPLSCDNTTGWTITTGGNYSTTEPSVKNEGTASLHLATTTWNPEIAQPPKSYLVGNNGTISFKSRLRTATATQTARLQTSTNNGTTWTTQWSQNGGTSETSFSTKTVALPPGDICRIRFTYTPADSAYLQGGTSYGWFVDDISFSNCEQIVTETETTSTVNSKEVIPENEGNIAFNVAPKNGSRTFPAGPVSKGTVKNPVSAWIENNHTGLDSDPLADPDTDGANNLVEYALNSNPASPGNIPQGILNENKLEMTMEAKAGVSYGAEWSRDLSTWWPLTNVGTNENPKFSVPTLGEPKVFMRLKLSLN